MTQGSRFNSQHLAFWAKLGSGRYPDDSHPVWCHLVDVGNVAHALWQESLRDSARQHWARTLGLPADVAGRWIAFWAGTHDIGKVCPGFQGQSGRLTDVITALKEAGYRFPTKDPVPHGAVSTRILSDALSQANCWKPIEPQLATRIAKAVGGHHGTFPDLSWSDFDSRDLGDGRWTAARKDILEELAHALDVISIEPPSMPPDNEYAFYFFLAGLTSVADWIGSNRAFFRPVGTRIDPLAYRRSSRNQARAALQELGWLDWKPDSVVALTFNGLFPQISSPRPLQLACVDVAKGIASPGVVVMESPMGEGKTEAALYLADTWIHSCGHQGLYVALPTQATSNQMFQRICRFLEQRYPNQLVNTHLLHGQALLSDDYDELRQRAKDRLATLEFTRIYDDSHGQVVASDWFAQDKKQGLLAPFAVGTIDQALMSVLQTRHMFVRLFGLAGKVVILDEVHAYDAYMSQLLERLLSWLAAMGCPVILLSATLPRDKRRRLIQAYCGHDLPEIEQPYPRLTIAMANEAPSSRAIATQPDRRRSLQLSWHDSAGLAAELQDLLVSGGCVAVICNTVGRAQQVYVQLRDALAGRGVDVRLFHARFPFGQRQQIETDVLNLFGPPDVQRQRPRQAVLVSTQVIEQSLDLDFDLLVTELAPLDLVLQRAGRLQRHARPLEQRPLGGPRLWILRPESGDAGVPDFQNSEYVYSRYILLRSFLALWGRTELNLPDDIEPLVESVYGGEHLSLPDAAWESDIDESRITHEQKIAKNETYAATVRILPPIWPDDILDAVNRDVQEDDPDANPKIQALTRLAEPSVSLLLLFGDSTDARWSLDRSGQETVDPKSEPSISTVKRLLKNAVTLSNHRCVHHFLSRTGNSLPAAWRDHSLLKFHHLVLLNSLGRYQFEKHILRWDLELGIVVERLD